MSDAAPPRHRARYFALEGIDGAGKSTLLRELARSLRAEGLRVALRREPAAAALGRRAQLLGRSDPWRSALLFTIDRGLARADLEEDLRRSDVVLTDRSFWSTIAYQGSALSAPLRRELLWLQEGVTVAPDRVLLLDLPPAESLRRLGHRGSARGPLERRRTLERVRRAYVALARAHRWTRLDARRPTDRLVELARRRVLASLHRGPRAAEPRVVSSRARSSAGRRRG